MTTEGRLAPEPSILPDAKRQKTDIPEGMSKNQWKKLQKQQRHEETKDEYRVMKREKRKAAKVRLKLAAKAAAENGGVAADGKIYHSAKKRHLPETQVPTNVQIIMDCGFDDLMNQKEIISMSAQVTRSYSAMRHCEYALPLTISSFNKTLKERFDKSISDYTKWQNIEFKHNESLLDILPPSLEQQPDAPFTRENTYYLTADTDHVIETLEPGSTYIIGGIVDKNRHKSLCVNKAKELGLKVGKLPIGKYIQMNGRHVLATSHVYEILCKWFETKGDWKMAFDEVLPPRKVKREEEEDKSAAEGARADKSKEAGVDYGQAEEEAELAVAPTTGEEPTP